MFLILFSLIFFTKSEIFTFKCFRWKNKFKISCGYIYQNYAEVEWYFRNQRILRSIDDFCETCNLKNELFMFELNEKYRIYFEDNKIFFKRNEELFVTEENQNFECFECLLNLYQ